MLTQWTMLVTGGAWSAAQPCGGGWQWTWLRSLERPPQIRANGTLMRMFTSQLLRARAVDNNRMWVSDTCKFLQSCLFQFHSFSRHSKTQSIYLKQTFFFFLFMCFLSWFYPTSGLDSIHMSTADGVGTHMYLIGAICKRKHGYLRSRRIAMCTTEVSLSVGVKMDCVYQINH